MKQNPYPVYACHYDIQQRQLIFIKAYIIDICNYNCSYCYNKMPRSKKILDLNKLLRFIERIYEQTHRHIFLELIGGEPTLHPGLVDFCKIIQQKDYINTIFIYSNLTSNINTYLALLNNDKMDLQFSWHSIKNDPINKSFYIKAKQLCSFNKIQNRFSFSVMYEQNNSKQALFVYKLLKMEGALVYLSQVGQLSKINSIGRYDYYTNNEYNQFISVINQTIDYPEVSIRYSNNSYLNVSLNNLMDILDKKQLSFYGWKCTAGINRYYVHCDEKIYRCAQEYENGLEPIFSLNDTAACYQCQPCICQCEVCLCEGFVEKEKI